MSTAENTVFGYLRVSTDKQDIDSQKLGVTEYANRHALGAVRYVQEKITGSKSWRKRKIKSVIDEAQKGDIILTSEVSRLGRSALDIFEMLKIALDKGVTVIAIKENLKFDGSMHSTIYAMALGMSAEIERALISARTKEGLNQAKARGKTLGRPKDSKNKKLKLDPHRKEIVKYLEMGVPKKRIAKMLGVAESSLHRWLKVREIKSYKEE